ncbi:hypothetical protein NUACC21_08460 [Scytonema sp. NUACC21]
MNMKKIKSIRSGLLSVGVFSALSFAALPFASQPAVTQAPLTVSADGNLNEYSPETAPLLVRGFAIPAVKDVQLFLKDLGFYYGPIDSVYGSRTSSAVASFQRSKNLPVSGAVNQRTWTALIHADRSRALVPISDISQYSAESAPKLQIGSKGPAVRDVQAFLKQQGYYTGAIDGVYGSSTAVAVATFQKKHNDLNNDGIVGYTTWLTMIDTARHPSVSS